MKVKNKYSCCYNEKENSFSELYLISISELMTSRR
jgi:hypothetical protein